MHGLSNDTSLDALATATRLCEVQDRTAPASSPCTTVPFSLSLVNRGRARLTVPSLNEGALYRIQTIGSAAVKDGYGQPLQVCVDRPCLLGDLLLAVRYLANATCALFGWRQMSYTVSRSQRLLVSMLVPHAKTHSGPTCCPNAGTGMQASSTVFETSSVAYTLQPPDVELTIVLEAGVDTLAAWPHVAHPPPPLPPGGKDWNTYMTSLGSWELDLDEPKQLDQLLRIQAVSLRQRPPSGRIMVCPVAAMRRAFCEVCPLHSHSPTRLQSTHMTVSSRRSMLTHLSVLCCTRLPLRRPATAATPSTYGRCWASRPWRWRCPSRSTRPALRPAGRSCSCRCAQRAARTPASAWWTCAAPRCVLNAWMESFSMVDMLLDVCCNPVR